MIKVNLLEMQEIINYELIKGIRKPYFESFHTYFGNLLPLSVRLYTFLFLYLLHSYSLTPTYSLDHNLQSFPYHLTGAHLPSLFSFPIVPLFSILFLITNFLLYFLSPIFSFSFLFPSFNLVYIVQFCPLYARS